MTDLSKHEAHELPISYRIIDDVIREWLDRATGIALACRCDGVDCETSERKAIKEMRHLRLDDYSYTVTPKIVDLFTRAGLLQHRGCSE